MIRGVRGGAAGHTVLEVQARDHAGVIPLRCVVAAGSLAAVLPGRARAGIHEDQLAA